MGSALVFGATGQVGTALAAKLTAAGVNIIMPGRAALDLTDAAAVEAFVRDCPAGTVYNAAAYTAVDQAESEPDIAMAVNADAPAAMARACAETGKIFIHLSTDYVFDGRAGRPYREEDATAPLNVYGASKRAGEKAVLAAGGAAAILRTSWVFSATGRNFVKTMLRLAAERESLSVVADQTGCPTPAPAIADAMMEVAAGLKDDPSKAGLYHFSGAPAVSWADFAQAILAAAGREIPVHGITTADYPTPAQRPAYTVLDMQLIMHVFGVSPADWRGALSALVTELESREGGTGR